MIRIIAPVSWAILLCLSHASLQTQHKAKEAIDNNSTRVFLRVVGGKKAETRIRKTLALLSIVSKAGERYSCTGSVIGKRWILCAAHCFVSPEFTEGSKVHVSKSLAFIAPRKTTPRANSITIPFKSVHVHKEFAAKGLQNDIAVVVLKENIPPSTFNKTLLGKEPPDKTVVIGAGYGAVNESGKPAKHVMQTKLLSQNFKTCQERESEANRKLLNKQGQVCATSLGFPNEGKTDTCFPLTFRVLDGDSGGPLFWLKNGKVFQYGITSYSTTACAQPGGVPWYTRVSAFESEITRLVVEGKSKKFKTFWA